MAIKPKTYSQASLLLKAIEISADILNKSVSLDNQTKTAFQSQNSYSKNYIHSGFKNDELSSYAVKTLEHEFFKYWNETVNQDIENFWEEINKNGLPYQRKSPITELLAKKRFRQVEQWIDLFNNLEKLKQTGILNKQFTTKEIKELYNLAEAEENKRLELVSKCLKKKKISLPQYQKFVESMAFLERCNLTLKYFSEQEREELFEMAKSTVASLK